MDPPPLEPDPLADRDGPWDGYLAGPENALAHAAAQELARGGPGISPLVVVGPAGSGKSRLLEGLAADRIARRPGASVASITAEAFADACHEAADADSPLAWAELRGRFRTLDLLALDDLHGLSRSPLAMAELAATLDDLDSDTASVVVTVRDDPGRWDDWPRRLADRLRGGLTVRLELPGAPARRRFLLDRARARGLTVTAEALDLLAEAADGYRTLDGWLARLSLASRVDRRPIDRQLAASMLADDIPGRPAVTITEVARAVASHFGLRPRDLRSASRRASVVEPRHLAILLARELTGASFAALGVAFGGRDTKTIRHACQAASSRIDADPALAAAAVAIRRRWSSEGAHAGELEWNR